MGSFHSSFCHSSLVEREYCVTRFIVVPSTQQLQIYDYMNVQSIHNATFAKRLPAGYLARARDLANWHEYNVFTDPALGGIGNSE